MVHGLTPTTNSGLEALQLKLSECGFAKTGIGELASAPLMWFDIKDMLKCDPDARFVLFGYDLGCPAAVYLARELSAKGVPVDAVVLLDPVACGEPSGIPTLLITNGTTPTPGPEAFGKSSRMGADSSHVSHLVVTDATHFKLPAHPETVRAITDLLKEIAARNWKDPGDPIPVWSFKHAPDMHAPAGGKHEPEWNFLADTSETPPSINPPPVGATVQQPAAAGPVPLAWSTVWRKP
jgi:pimeloyl-ACP methyl ester carboxylesterase